jgi:hypothetical protein
VAGETIQGETGPLVDDPVIGHPVRAGDWAAHAASSYDLAAVALTEGRFADAAELARHTVEEAREGYELYAAWTDQIGDYLRAEGVDTTTIAAGEARLLALVTGEGEEPFDIHRGWAAYTAGIDEVEAACRAHDATAAREALGRAKSIWRGTHDPGADLVYGMLDLVVRHLGEDRIGPLWDDLMAPMYETYDVYDTANHPWPRSMHRLIVIAALSLRGHLSGPGRAGSVEVTEEADRWVLRFDPCGTGGRTYRDDDPAGPRMLPPYDFAVTTEEHDWAWRKKGVCVYCVHCCQLNQRMPISRFGYPTRVVDPPTWPDARSGGTCSWSIYKDPSLVPAEAYERVGFKKPAALGGGGAA